MFPIFFLMKTDITSAIINTIGLIFFVIANIILFLKVEFVPDAELQIWIIIYGIILIIFWPIQITYHIIVNAKKEPNFLRRIDRGSMLFLIAAIFSPLLIRYTIPTFAFVSNIILWISAGLGMILLLVLKNMPRKLAPIVGFVMGIFGIIALISYIVNIPQSGVVLFILGSMCLMLGGLVYALKKPDPKPEVFGFHELFHTFMTVGAVLLHFLILMSIGL
jgi:hemolysin III